MSQNVLTNQDPELYLIMMAAACHSRGYVDRRTIHVDADKRPVEMSNLNESVTR